MTAAEGILKRDGNSLKGIDSLPIRSGTVGNNFAKRTSEQTKYTLKSAVLFMLYVAAF